jgi:outer membrane immunogenic protein
MKALIATAAAAVMTLTAAPALADVYGSLGYSKLDADGPEFDAVTGRLGWRSGWFGVEGEVSGGVNDETVTVGVTPVDVDLKHQIAAYAVGFVPMNESVDLFARVGYGQTKIEATAAGTGFSGSAESWNWGVGAQFFFGGGANGVRGDFTRHNFDDGDADLDVWSVSYVRKF